jgi:hypothetical protein
MANDEPWENHGCEILIAYSSTYAKEKDPVHYSTPDAMYKKLREDPDTEYVLGIEDFRLVDVLAPKPLSPHDTNYVLDPTLCPRSPRSSRCRVRSGSHASKP